MISTSFKLFPGILNDPPPKKNNKKTNQKQTNKKTKKKQTIRIIDFFFNKWQKFCVYELDIYT